MINEHFDKPTAAWLMREMAENRDSKVAKHKSYDMCAVHEACSSQSLDLSEEPTSPHNWMGTCELLRKLQADPSVLEPQGTASRA